MFAYRTVDHRAAEMEAVCRLRYKVYCLECGYEKAGNYRNGLETDEFDSVSTHFLASETDSGNAVGTARIIHAEKKGLPVLKYCNLQRELLPDVPLAQVGEISRLAVSKEYRRRAVDTAIASKNITRHRKKRETIGLRRRFETTLVCGLYSSIYRESVELGLTHLFAVMSEGLYSLLQKRGVAFDPVGPLVEYHGFRRPYLAVVEENRHVFEISPRLAVQG